MLPLRLASGPDTPLRVLCLGAHSDDIEIGCGGTVLRLAESMPQMEVTWIVFSADPQRAEEARCSAERFLGGACRRVIVVKQFRDGFFPYVGESIKSYFEHLKQEVTPNVVFTHYRGDGHQDHRVICELTWNTFRDHLILEYEVPKYDGDLGRPNCYMPLDERTCREKVQHLLAVFASQRDRPWFTEETFRGLMRLRGVECGAPDGYAEAFYAHKLALDLGPNKRQ